jgi:hypothetical protein
VCNLVANPQTGQVFLEQGQVLWSLPGSAHTHAAGVEYVKVGETPGWHEWHQAPEKYGPVWLVR